MDGGRGPRRARASYSGWEPGQGRSPGEAHLWFHRGVGVLSSAVLAASQATQAYAFDHQGFLLGLLWMLVSFWPLLLVIVGAVLLQDAFTEKVRALPTSNQYFQHNPFKNNAFKNNATGCRFRCPSFDV